MSRINWDNFIVDKFGNEEFTVEMVQEASGQNRQTALAALGRCQKRRIVKKLRNGNYKFSEGSSSTRSFSTKGFIKTLSLKYGDSPFSVDQICEVFETDRRTLHARMGRLKKNGLVEGDGKGVYKLTTSGHNFVAEDFKEEFKNEKNKEGLPSCILIKMEGFLGKDKMKDWVYETVMKNEECVGILEDMAVKSIAKTAQG